ncbi:type II toxin-antitoxin system prevent-host-death family antitoxin [Candidatus Saccharibacteria bacterium]|nr:type II toxin-antitoxin system prevent-host-death family antitoxin [Candidatus Saccharibacteria bacterium]
MSKAVSIYDAKSNLSKLIADVKAGKQVVIGSFGKPEVMLVPYVKTNKLNIGVWDSKKIKLRDDLIGPDDSIAELFSESLEKDLPR